MVVNNGMYGTIRMHQEKHYPGRVIGTELANPHFAAFARSFGAVGEIVEDTAQFGPAFERCLRPRASRRVIEVRIDPQAITPNTTLDADPRGGRGAWPASPEGAFPASVTEAVILRINLRGRPP